MSSYDFTKYISANKPVLNGGLYSGEPFKGPWGNTPVIADAVTMTKYTLLSANPPPNATKQFGDNIRPGNNQLVTDNIPIGKSTGFVTDTNIHCINLHPTQLQNYDSYDPNPHIFYQAW
jgi:hypothetical protein